MKSVPTKKVAAIPVESGAGSFGEVEQRIATTRKRLRGYPHERVTVARLITHVQKRQSERINVVLKRHDLNHVTYTALMMMYGSEAQTLTASQLSQATGEKPNNLTRICDELLAKGLIDRYPGIEDRRKVVLKLTRKGEALVERFQPELWQLLGETYGVFDASELRTLTRLLRKMLSQLDRDP
jgi:MarR family transcriptional repressor of emrRAB